MLMMLGLRAGGFGARAADELLMSHDAGVAGAREAFGSMVADARDAGVVGGPGRLPGQGQLMLMMLGWWVGPEASCRFSIQEAASF